MNTATFDVAGKVNGNLITTADAGAATPWDSVSASGIVYSSDAAHGPLSAEVTDVGQMVWLYSGLGPTEFGRFYVKQVSCSSSIAQGIRYADAGDNTMCRIVLNASGQVNILDSSSSIVGTTTAQLTANTWGRVEWSITFSATVGAITVRLYTSMDSATITETLVRTSQNLRGTTFGITELGILGFNSGDKMRLDSVVTAAAAYPGPDAGGTGYTDAATELFKLTPSGPDVYTGGPTNYTDSATTRLSFTPSGVDVTGLKPIQRPVGPTALSTSLSTYYTVPATKKFIVRGIKVCNTSGSQRAITLKMGGQSIFFNQPIDINGTLPWTGWEVMLPGEQLQASADAAGCTLVVSGVEV